LSQIMASRIQITLSNQLSDGLRANEAFDMTVLEGSPRLVSNLPTG